jgi:methyl-accepting chemotaxis protein
VTERLPSGTAFSRGLIGVQTLVGFTSAALVVGYLMALLRLTPEQWRFFTLLVGAYALVNFPISERFTSQGRRPVTQWLDDRERGQGSPEQAQGAFAAVLVLPTRAFLIGLAGYAAGGVSISVGMWLRYPDVSAGSIAIILAATATGGFAMNCIFFFVTKRWLEPIRETLTAEVPDPELRGPLVRRVPLTTKLGISLAGVALSTVLFALFLAQERSRVPLEDHVSAVQRRFLERSLPRLEAEGEAALTPLGSEASALGIASRLEILDAQRGPEDVLTDAEWRTLLSSGAGSGASGGFDSQHVFAWQRLDDSRVAVASFATAELDSHFEGLWLVFAGLLAAAGVVSLVLSRLIAGDVSRSVAALGRQADRIASGDLERQGVLESEDELGDLGRSFESMAGALRLTVSRVAQASDRLEGTASSLAGVGEEVKVATARQVGGIAEARRSMDRLSGEVAGIADSAHGLNVSVEEASSSILELGASGEELNETAQGLSERVEAVSSSIEETVRSVRAVSGQTQALSSAASETSTSMEEMASSLREVDSNADEMARLSQEVVQLSEAGREKVRLTIEGMEAIRDATEAAEGVIGSLSGRAQEIGAIVDVIDDVADETNLLALNAAIIAAQAGDSGRAFSVVADAIKELADRVMASTKEIGTVIRAVQEESRSAQAAVERGSASVLSGVELSAQAGESLETITRQARGSGERVREIVGAVQEQSKAAVHVVALMERVRDGVETIRRAGTEQERGHEVVMASAEAMRDVSQLVHRTTEEQARGAGRIRDSIEGVRLAAETIHRALQAQSEACAEAAAGLGCVADETDSHQQSVETMAEATGALRDEAKGLRDDVDRFRI